MGKKEANKYGVCNVQATGTVVQTWHILICFALITAPRNRAINYPHPSDEETGALRRRSSFSTSQFLNGPVEMQSKANLGPQFVLRVDVCRIITR